MMNINSPHILQLLTGTNMGNREENLEEAAVTLEAAFGHVTGKSHIYQTDAWGIEAQADFLNQVLIIETHLNAEECMKNILLIENKMGRVRTVKMPPGSLTLIYSFTIQTLSAWKH